MGVATLFFPQKMDCVKLFTCHIELHIEPYEDIVGRWKECAYAVQL